MTLIRSVDGQACISRFSLKQICVRGPPISDAFSDAPQNVSPEEADGHEHEVHDFQVVEHHGVEIRATAGVAPP